MTRLLVCVLGVLYLQVAQAAEDSMPNEDLYDECRTQERFKSNRQGMTGADAVKAMSCISYMAGALHMYNMKSESECNLDGRTVDRFISDYLAFTRRTGSLEAHRRTVVFMLLETCYCGKNPGMQFSCPTSTPESR